MKENKTSYTNPEVSFLFATLALIFLFYIRTVFYEVKAFDEIVPLKESYLPICHSFSEMFELISLLGLNQHFEASNTFYSHITTLRCNPFGNFLQMFIQVLFQKNPIKYHLYSLFLHLINSALVFLILNKVSSFYFKVGLDVKKITMTSLLTLLWATHPANVESVLLLSNANIVLSYTFCFIATYFFMQGKNFLFYLIPYTLSLFIAEFHFFLPVILFLSSLFTKGSLKQALKVCFPLFITTLIYFLLFISSKTSINFQASAPIQTHLERVFWLSPQIIFHIIKTTFLPVKLSIDQASLLKLGESIFDPYAIFCIFFLLLIISVSVVDFIKTKTRPPFIFFIITMFLLAIMPFSHIFAPFYNLFSERYLYYPLFILIFSLSYFIYYLMSSDEKRKNIILIVVLFITVIYSYRAFVRTLDWKDSFTLYYSAINASSSDLYKGFRYKGLVNQDNVFSNLPHKAVDAQYQILAADYLKKCLSESNSNENEQSPMVLKNYGLDKYSKYLKTGYLYAHSIYTQNKNTKEAIEIIKPYMKDIKTQDPAAISFYSALLYYDKKYDEAENILREGLKYTPYSKRLIFPLCELIQFRSGYTKEVEELLSRAFLYFPYDSLSLLEMVKYTLAKKDYNKFAFFSYVYGLRSHSSDDLINARNVYERLGKNDMVKKIEKSINIQGHNL